MPPRFWRMTGRVGWVLVLGWMLAATAGAQILRPGGGNNGAVSNPPVITAIEPSGATIGAITEWKVRGSNLATVDRWTVRGEGVEVVSAEAKSDAEAAVRVRVSDNAAPGTRELRAIGPDGLSNLALFRVDALPQHAEVEPNDMPGKAQEVRLGSAIAGILKAQDLDHFRLPGRRGARVTIEVEAQRVGTPILPVLTLYGPNGLAVAQARESRGTEHDARLSYVFPEDGPYVVQVRDNLYGGSDDATYRLRVLEAGPFATGLFPLGGPKGQTITVEASGGNLDEPRMRTITLPDEPGTIDPGPFDGPGGPISVPMKLIVSEGTEVVESAIDAPEGSTTPIEAGQTANGRIGQPGEVDRYTLPVKKGESIAVRIRAAELGSWLDSVVRVVDAEGEELEQNDDAGVNNAPNQPFQPFRNQAPADPDSRLTFAAKEDGMVTIEVFDRYGNGGSEYAYRLEVGPPSPDFAVKLLLGDLDQIRQQARFGQQRIASRVPGANGSLNLKPGSTTTINFLVTGEGAVGKIQVRAEGLPDGVTAEPVEVSPPAFLASNRPLPPTGGALVLKVDPEASASLGQLRIVASNQPPQGDTIIHHRATATILLDATSAAPAGAPSLPITREVHEIPIWVAGDTRPAELRPGFVGPPKPLPIALKGVNNPGVLLQGDRLDLALELDPPAPPLSRYALETETDAPGLTLQTLVNEPLPSRSATDPEEPAALVRVLADVKAPAGEREITIRLRSFGQEPIQRVEKIQVRPPIALKPREETLTIRPGEPATLHVAVHREEGVSRREAVQIALGLPEGVQVADPSTLRLSADQETAAIPLTLEPGAVPPQQPIAITITGTIRMPRGRVGVDSAVRPMLSGRRAEN